MGKSTAVLLITGFLGSGKTTFLNRIVNTFPKELKLTILMNEFGEIGIDGTLIEGDDIEMLEISRGSIFCVCVKADFIKGLYELSNTVKPDLLIIESTGVANPTDLKKDLQLPIFKDRFTFAEQVCIIDAAHFLDAYNTFVSVEKQLETSTSFIVNKADMVSNDVLQEIRTTITRHHPAPIIFETTYAHVPLSSFPSLTQLSGLRNDSTDDLRDLAGPVLDEFIAKMLENPEGETGPPDRLASVTFVWHGKDLTEVEDMTENLPRGIVRAKGLAKSDSGIHLFSYVMGDWTITPFEQGTHEIKNINMFVFIGDPSAITRVGEAFSSKNWSARQIVKPFTQIGKM